MKTILVVDDNATLAYLTARNLRSDLEGVDVVTASSCREALEAAETTPPGVVILDLKLPDGNGIDLAEELRSRLPDIAYILISGVEEAPEVGEGCVGFLRKPYETSEVIRLVRKAMDAVPDAARPVSSRPAAESTPLLKDPHTTDPSAYNRHQLVNRLTTLFYQLRAFEADLSDMVGDSTEIREYIADQVNELCSVLKEVSQALPPTWSVDPDRKPPEE